MKKTLLFGLLLLGLLLLASRWWSTRPAQSSARVVPKAVPAPTAHPKHVSLVR